MTVKRKFSHKLVSIFLCVALLVSYLPTLSAFADSSSTGISVSSDKSTMDSWRDFFYPESGEISTENAGGVWTDKSVFTDDSAFSGTGITKDSNDSLLVALSSIGSNMTVTGTSNVPIDTIFVLDVSGSMSGDARDLVNAANTAIAKLFENKNNRVGVVLYSGTRNSNTNNDAAVVLLPLGNYKTASDKKYLVLDGSTIEVDGDVKDTATNAAPVSTGKSVTGATYIQKGLILAKDQFVAESNVINSADNRKPVLVLMSDGDPTLGSTNFAAPGQFNLGDGSSTSSALGFVTQLSAAYAKQQIEAKYKTKALVYTLGLGLSNSNTVAINVLDPDNTLRDDTSKRIKELWTTYNTAVEDETVVVSGRGSWAKTVQKIAEPLEQLYVNQYFSASQGSDLANAFQQIVDEIALQSEYFPTLVEGSEHLSGYVTFIDKIGKYMDVTDVKGILMGDSEKTNSLFSGAELAKQFTATGALGTYDNPSELGNEMYAAVQQRLGISDIDTARNLVNLAFRNNQISYTNENNYSNYIGWVSNAAGKFLDFYNEGTTPLPAATADADTNPVYTVKSYGYLGTVNQAQGVTDTDMMYATVQVRTNIETQEKTVIFAVPAALIPHITYRVSLTDGGIEDVTVDPNSAEHPISLVYEVGLRSDINKFNVNEKIAADYLAVADNLNADGSINFYSNSYETEISPTTGKKDKTGYTTVNTYSYFRPSHQNDRYYFTQDTAIYTDDQGTVYSETAEPSISETYYRKHTVYKKNGTAQIVEGYHELTAAAIEDAAFVDGKWVIPAGHIRSDYAGYTMEKAVADKELTDTLVFANQPFIDAGTEHIDDPDHSYVIGATLGNNGKLTITPATGIKLSKAFEGTAPVGTAFSFKLESAAVPNGSYDAYKLLADGTVDLSFTSVAFSGGIANVALQAGETVYIELPAGANVTVTEAESADYIVKKINGSDATLPSYTFTTVENTLTDVSFTNAVREKGTLTVSKVIEHELGTAHTIPSDLSFKIEVTLIGIGTQNTEFDAEFSTADPSAEPTAVKVTTDQNGKFTRYLKHNEQIEVFGLPAGTKAIVREIIDSAKTGFYPEYWEDTDLGNGEVDIVGNGNVSVIVLNDYRPKEVFPVNIDVSGTKTLNGRDNDEWLDTDSFIFKLQKYVPATDTEAAKWIDVGSAATVDKTTPNYAFELNDFFGGNDGDANRERYTVAGTYYYRVIETEGSIEGITYDHRTHAFAVDVTDTDMDGQLEVSQVRKFRDDDNLISVTEPTENNYKVTTGFINTYSETGSTDILLEINKTIKNLSESTLPKRSGFEFALYQGDNEILRSEKTTGSGTTKLNINKDILDAENASFTTELDGDKTNYVYNFTLKEIIPAAGGDKQAGILYDAENVNVTVVMTKQEISNVVHWSAVAYETANGAASATAILTVAQENTYEPTVASLKVDFVEKQLINAQSFSDKALSDFAPFTFALKNKAGDVLMTGQNDANGKVTMKDALGSENLTYDKVGVYFYDIVETSTGGSGISVDNTVFQVTVEVTDKGGELVATHTVISVADNKAVFKNTYTTAPTVPMAISGTKKLLGRASAMLNGEFTFTLTEATDANGTVLPGAKSYNATNNTEGLFKFQEFVYDSIGTSYYVVEETVPSGETYGVKYDTSKFVVIVDVTDVNGQLVAGISYKKGESNPTEILFENRYEASSANADIIGKKLLEGRDLAANEFEFELYSSDELKNEGTLLDTVKNAADGTFKFVNIPDYTAVGTHYYLIKEKGGTLGGITYDTTVYWVKVNVTDNNIGKLVTQTLVYDLNNALYPAVEFTNEYAVTGTAHADVSGKKTLDVVQGKLELNAGDFTFDLYKANSSYTKEGNAIDNTTNDAEGNFSFTINYAPEHVGNIYYYVVEERQGATDKGMTYSKVKYRVKVEVKDDVKDGKIEVATSVTDEDDKPIAVTGLDFTNKYEAKETFVQFEGVKKLDAIKGDRKIKKDDFTFDVYEADSSFKTKGTALQSVPNDAEGNFKFDKIPLKEEKIYYFVIKENSTTSINGVIYDESVYNIEITVEDNHNGELKIMGTRMTRVNDSGSSNATSILFENKYNAEATSINIKGKKELPERDLKAGEFEFKLYTADENFVIKNEITPLQAVNLADGNFTFDSIPYDNVGTHYYVVEEVEGNLGGITYDKTVYRVTVKVTDDENGKLKANATYTDANSISKSSIKFKNNYAVTGKKQVELSGKKTLKVTQGERELKADDFTFELYKANSSYAKQGTALQSPKNDAEGNFKFNLEYLPADVGNTYYYVITEAKAGETDKGITYSNDKYRVKVVVKDEVKDGVIEADVTVLDKDSKNVATDKLNFENTYKAETAKFKLEGEKVLKNKKLSNKDFTFKLFEAKENGEIVEGKEPKIAQNDAEGNIVFDVSYTEVGQYFYVLKEEKGNDPRISYDDVAYFVAIHIFDDENGKLDKEIRVTKLGDTEQADIVFNNAYIADTSFDININKKVENKGSEKITAKDFEFILENVATKAQLKGISNQDGKAVIKLDFTAEDVGKTFNYKLYEANTAKANVKYSDVVYTVAVKVDINDQKQLVLDVSLNDVKIDAVNAEFVNEYDYTPETPKEPESPKTGDNTNIHLLFALLFVSGGMLAVGAKRRKNRS